MNIQIGVAQNDNHAEATQQPFASKRNPQSINGLREYHYAEGKIKRKKNECIGQYEHVRSVRDKEREKYLPNNNKKGII